MARGKSKRVLVTGGAGFIGSAFIRYGLARFPDCERIINLDALTYAANLKNLESIEEDPRYAFVQGDINDFVLVEQLCSENAIDAIVHFAAETHVDRSICNPQPFLQSNVVGTCSLLEVVRKHPQIHFHHVSTDEVYGSLGESGFFNEQAPYRPNSPYAASKAAADHFVRAYAHTYGISTSISHCTNNYGPCQDLEKLIPFMLRCLVENEELPVYGNGLQVRDWLYVDDHVEALWQLIEMRRRGSVYDIGGNCEKRNIDLIHLLIHLFCRVTGQDPMRCQKQIRFVKDRPGHDLRYAIDCAKIKAELSWKPKHAIEDGLEKTIRWYLQNSFFSNNLSLIRT